MDDLDELGDGGLVLLEDVAQHRHAVLDQPQPQGDRGVGHTGCVELAERLTIASGAEVSMRNATRDVAFVARHGLSARQVDLLLAGGLIPWLREPARVAVT